MTAANAAKNDNKLIQRVTTSIVFFSEIIPFPTVFVNS